MPGKDEWAWGHFGADNSSRTVSKTRNSERVTYPKKLENPAGNNIFCAGRVLGRRRLGLKTEVEKLNESLKDAKNFNIFPGEKFPEATPEEIARSINRALDAPKSEYLPLSSRVYEWVRSKFYW